MAEKRILVVEVTPKGIGAAKKQLDQLANSAGKSEMSFTDLAKKIAGFTTVADLAVNAGRKLIQGIKDLGKESIALSMDFEKARVSWGVLAGSMEEGTKIFAQLQEYATTTPLTFKGLEDAATTLAGFGFEVSDLVPTLEKLGDVAKGDDATLNNLANAFGRIKAEGQASTRTLLQFISNGIPIFDLLADSMGGTAQDIKQLVSDGKIGFEEVERAIKNATAEGGRFHGMMDKIAQTSAGQTTQIKGNLDIIKASIGASLLELASPILEDLNEHLTETVRIAAATRNLWLNETTDIDAGIEYLEDSLERLTSGDRDFIERITRGQFSTTLPMAIKIYEDTLNKLREQQHAMLQHEAMMEARTRGAEAALAAKVARQKELADQAEREAAAAKEWRDLFSKATGVAMDGKSGATGAGEYLQSLDQQMALMQSFGDTESKAFDMKAKDIRRTIETLLESGLFTEADSSIQVLRRAYIEAMEAAERTAKAEKELLDIEKEREAKYEKLKDLYKWIMDGTAETLAMSWEQLEVSLRLAGAEQLTIETLKEQYFLHKEIADEEERRLAATEKYELSIKAIEDALISAGMNAYVDAFKSLGEALATGANAGETFAEAMANIGKQIVNQLPLLLLQAGLNALGMDGPGSLGIGLALIGASGLVAIGAGAANAKQNAVGNVYSSPSLSSYSNGVYNSPQYFGWEGTQAFAKGGVFAEAGPEAIMPLGRDSSGRLGVRASGGVQIIINNNANNTEVKQSESTGANGEKQIIVTIENVVKSAFANGKMDGAMNRYGVRPRGIK